MWRFRPFGCYLFVTVIRRAWRFITFVTGRKSGTRDLTWRREGGKRDSFFEREKNAAGWHLGSSCVKQKLHQYPYKNRHIHLHSLSSSESSSLHCLNIGGRAGPISLSDDMFDVVLGGKIVKFLSSLTLNRTVSLPPNQQEILWNDSIFTPEVNTESVPWNGNESRKLHAKQINKQNV